jgi:hypothetical protein
MAARDAEGRTVTSRSDEVITLSDQIASVQREIRMRSKVYPRWVADKKLTQSKADHEIAAMRAVLATLEQVRAGHEPELALNGG